MSKGLPTIPIKTEGAINPNAHPKDCDCAGCQQKRQQVALEKVLVEGADALAIEHGPIVEVRLMVATTYKDGYEERSAHTVVDNTGEWSWEPRQGLYRALRRIKRRLNILALIDV